MLFFISATVTVRPPDAVSCNPDKFPLSVLFQSFTPLIFAEEVELVASILIPAGPELT